MPKSPAHLARLAAATLAAATLTLTLAGPATAAPTIAFQPTLHCVSEAVPAGSTTIPKPPTCFPVFADAIAFATDGAVILSPKATTVTQQQLDAGHTTARASGITPNSVVLGISYWDTGWNNNDSTWVHSAASGCDTNADVDWQIPSGFSNWDNKIGSAEAFSNCHGIYWSSVNFFGANVGTPWSSGPMNNETSSIQWT